MSLGSRVAGGEAERRTGDDNEEQPHKTNDLVAHLRNVEDDLLQHDTVEQFLAPPPRFRTSNLGGSRSSLSRGFPLLPSPSRG